MVTPPRPSSLSRTLALVPPVVALLAQQASGQMFLKVELANGSTIIGESTNSKFAGWIEVSSVQAGISTPVTLGSSSGSIAAGKATPTDLTFTKALDRASPQLFLGCAQGTRYRTVTLDLTAPNGSGGQVTYYRITLSNVVVSSLNTSGGGDRPTESVSLSYEKITTDYYLVDSKGTVPPSPTSTATWNFATSAVK